MNSTLLPLHRTRRDSQKVRRVVQRLFAGYTGGFGIRMWDGQTMSLGQNSPVATVVIHAATFFRHLAWRPDLLRLAECYFNQEIDVEGDLYALLKQKKHLQSLVPSVGDRLALFSTAVFSAQHSPTTTQTSATSHLASAVQTGAAQRHSKAHNRQAIGFHYDVSNDFYRLWLDEQMVYSCAYFNEHAESLAQAQQKKLEHICRKLRLREGERLLDIGCGWGALICWAAQHYGVVAHGITLSRQQYDFTRARIIERGLENQVTVELQDYRDLPDAAAFDKISSIGMFEHVGLKNLPTYFAAVERVLKPGGLFLNHGITDNQIDKPKTIGTEFIKRYVFPDGELDSVSNVQRAMERGGFEIADVEALRPHYALTLRHWVSRLEAQRDKAVALVGEAKYRVWRLYMAGCAMQFENGAIGVYQILASKRHDGMLDLPLTRRDIYR